MGQGDPRAKFVTTEAIIIYHNTYMYLKTVFKNNLLRNIYCSDSLQYQYIYI